MSEKKSKKHPTAEDGYMGEGGLAWAWQLVRQEDPETEDDYEMHKAAQRQIQWYKKNNRAAYDASVEAYDKKYPSLGKKVMNKVKKLFGGNKGGLTKPKMRYGGSIGKKKHNYAAGGSVKDKLGVIIAVGKIKGENGRSTKKS